MKLLLIRHGQTEANVKGLIHKKNDPVGLSDLGKKQANFLVPVIKHNQTEAIYSSPEICAVETAEIISDGSKVDSTTLEELSERNWGEWAGKTWNEIQDKLDSMILDERYEFIPPLGESWQQMDERLEKCIKVIIKSNQNIVLVTHEGVLRALVTILNNASKGSSFNLHFENTSVSIFEYKNSNFRQIALNDVSHLAL